MALEREDCFHNQYYDYIRRLLTIVGLWPCLKRSRRLPCVSLIFILLLIGINGQVYLIVILILDNKPELIPEIMQTLLPISLFTTIYGYLLYNSALIKKILERISIDWKTLSSDDESSILVTYAAQTKVASHLIVWSFLFYGAFLILPCTVDFFLYISGIIDETRVTVPIHHEIFVTSKHVYYFWFLMQTVIILATYVVGITHYILFITLLQHACALFTIVTIKIEQLFKENKYSNYDWKQTVSKSKMEYVWIVTAAKNYNNTINFVELIRSLYGKIHIVALSTSFGFVITDFIYFFQLLDFVVTTMQALKICLYINGSMVVIYVYFYLGERLIEHSISVYKKCLLVPFYKLSVRTNKLLLLLTMRSERSCNLSVSGVAVASHELYAKVMKASFSFATVFYNVR